MSEKLRNLIFEYYKDYYKLQLGLKDWRQRVELRLNEEKNFSQQNFLI